MGPFFKNTRNGKKTSICWKKKKMPPHIGEKALKNKIGFGPLGKKNGWDKKGVGAFFF